LAGDGVKEDASLTDAIQRYRRGDPEAVGVIFTYYAEHLSRLAQQYLSSKVAARVDEEDVVQSVFRTFFNRSAKGEFRIDSKAELWQLLVKITVMKARAKGRQHTAAKRDVRAERSGDEWLLLAAAREPGPEEAAVLLDQIEVLLKGLPPLHCQVLQLRLEGHRVADIAAQLGVSRHTVYRALDLLEERLNRTRSEA
jgi:RNA polymerase sigma-70 factor (ECF subfamily)